ncbi:hypothetical protein EYF80_031245 [Liparis tanakae]|uniref:Uncharacterized protein n=1 Tax=Liparis tanakae TaxID=230148 RepID=A0A4Z2H0E4_9TELE|nr:hypothetical protein EYF80_031245 [Liparis tanakae]
MFPLVSRGVLYGSRNDRTAESFHFGGSMLSSTAVGRVRCGADDHQAEYRHGLDRSHSVAICPLSVDSREPERYTGPACRRHHDFSSAQP